MAIPYLPIASTKYPAPIIQVEVIFKGLNKREPYNLLIDTGAGISAFPVDFLENELQALPVSSKKFFDFDRNPITKNIYVLNLIINGI